MIELKTLKSKIKTDDLSVKVIVFNFENSSDLLGLTCNEWLKIATLSFNTEFVNEDVSIGEEEQILKLLDNSDITIVLHAFNPLITNENIAFYLDYLTYKNLDLVKFPFGYVFKTSYIKQTKSFKEPILFNGVSNEFLKVENKQSFDVAYLNLKQRIINKHLKNGVNFVDAGSTIVHYFVEIEKGTTIYPFNLITGKSKILKNAVLKEGNTIEDSVVEEECVVAKSVINSSIIGRGTIISPFNTIKNSKIERDCLIKSYNQIENSHILEKTTIESFNIIGE